MSTNETIFLCAVAAFAGYWYGRQLVKFKQEDAGTQADADPLAWLGNWAQV